MRLTLAVHILAGSLALVFGFVALSAAKGATVHRRIGRLFVYAMLAMATTAAVMAALEGTEGSVLGGVMTCYFVVTALTAVRPPAWWSPRQDIALMLLALAACLTSFAMGVATLASPTGTRDGLPPFPFFMFGIVGLLAGIGDARMIRSGGLHGAPRLARHLWRMCWALWIASGSFFLGQADEFPVALRIPALLAIPALTPLVAMLYWLWRVRVLPSMRRGRALRVAH